MIQTFLVFDGFWDCDVTGALADSLGDALDTLHSAKQNCVLAIPSAGEGGTVAWICSETMWNYYIMFTGHRTISHQSHHDHVGHCSGNASRNARCTMQPSARASWARLFEFEVMRSLSALLSAVQWRLLMLSEPSPRTSTAETWVWQNGCTGKGQGGAGAEPEFRCVYLAGG